MLKYSSVLLVTLLGAALSACVISKPEPIASPIRLPENFLAASDKADNASAFWWMDFNDDQLNRFVDTALSHNPALAQTIARTRIAEAQARANRGELLPQIGASLTSARQKQNLSGFGLPIDLGDTSFMMNNHSASLEVSWELDLWGRLSSLSAAGQADFFAASEQLRGVQQAIAAEVVRLYIGLVQARAQLDLSERTVTALAEMSRQINNRAKVGIAAPTDSMLANANLESARAGMEQRAESVERTVRQLEIIMGAYPSGTLETVKTLPQLPATPGAGIPAELLVRRPDVRAAEWSLHAAGYRFTAAQRSFLPSIALTGSTGVTSNEFSNLFSSSNAVWSIAGNILQPVFQGGRLRAQVDMADGQREEVLNAYAEVVLTALAEVETALVMDDVLERREIALDKSASSAEDAVRVSLSRYLQGIDPFLNVLESQQRALDSRSAHIAAQFARLDNRIDLHLALGGGFNTSSTSPIVPTGNAAHE